jgi:hypothetical protein
LDPDEVSALCRVRDHVVEPVGAQAVPEEFVVAVEERAPVAALIRSVERINLCVDGGLLARRYFQTRRLEHDPRHLDDLDGLGIARSGAPSRGLDDQRHPDQGLEEVAVVTRDAVLAEELPVVRRDDDDGPIELAGVFEVMEQSPELVVHVRDLGVVGCVREASRELGRRCVRLVGIEVVEEEEEGLAGRPLEPSQGALGHGTGIGPSEIGHRRVVPVVEALGEPEDTLQPGAGHHGAVVYPESRRFSARVPSAWARPRARRSAKRAGAAMPSLRLSGPSGSSRAP